MRVEKLFVTDMELDYGQETQGREEQLLSWTGSIKIGALRGMLELICLFSFDVLLK